MGKLKITPKRLADIASQILTVIKLICEVKGYDCDAILKNYTNITEEEFEYIYSCKTHTRPNKDKFVITRGHCGFISKNTGNRPIE